MRCDVSVAGSRLTERGSQCATLDQGTVLVCDGKEGASRNLFPEVIPSLVPGSLSAVDDTMHRLPVSYKARNSPVLRHIVQVILDDGPEDARGSVSITVVDEPVGVSNQSNCPESRTVSLRPSWSSYQSPVHMLENQRREKCMIFRLTPAVSEGAQIDVKFGLAQTGAIRERAGRVGHALQCSLGGNIVLDLRLQGGVVAVLKSVYQLLEDEGGVSCPGVEVVRADLAGGRNHSSGSNAVRIAAIRPNVAEEPGEGDGTFCCDEGVDVTSDDIRAVLDAACIRTAKDGLEGGSAQEQ